MNDDTSKLKPEKLVTPGLKDYAISPDVAAVLLTLAQLMPSLSEPEVRVLLHLCGEAARTQSLTVGASSRRIAQEARVSRAAVQRALDRLQSRGVLTLTAGTTSTEASAVLQVLKIWNIEQLRARAAAASAGGFPGGPPPGLPGGPPPPPGGLPEGPALDQEVGHPGSPGKPPLASPEGHPPDADDGSTGLFDLEAGVLSNRDQTESSFEKLLDRITKARPGQYPREDLKAVRDFLGWFQARYAPPEARGLHPPDDLLCAQVLALVTKDQLGELLMGLARERCTAGRKYGWYLTVIMDRVYRVRPTEGQRLAAKLRLVGAARKEMAS